MKSFAKSSVPTTVTFCSVLCLSLLGVTNSQQANAASLGNWSSYNYDSLGTRYNSTETKINPTTAQQLRISWEFPTEGNVNATPTIYDNKVYAGDTNGNFYSLKDIGLWTKKVVRVKFTGINK
jgi:PQQ-like domain